MYKKIFIAPMFLTFLISIISFQSFAQNGNMDSAVQIKPDKKVNRNFIKTNLTSIPLKNYSVQYERVLNRKFSVALQFRVMPTTGIPFKNSIINLNNTFQENFNKTIEDLRVSNFAITPEFRFYLSKKGYGHGFYMAPFYRYASFKISDNDLIYTDDNGVDQTLKMSGKLTSNTGGFLLGIQHTYGKVVLDIWLLGPHIGVGKGTFTGKSTRTLSSTEQDRIRARLEDFGIPLTTKTIAVNASSATLKLDGPWGGIRSGLSLGIKF